MLQRRSVCKFLCWRVDFGPDVMGDVELLYSAPKPPHLFFYKDNEKFMRAALDNKGL